MNVERSVLTCRNEMSSALSSSSMALIVCESVDISLLSPSIFSFITWLFCFSSFLSAAILASSSSCRNWWSFLNSSLICLSVCWVWTWRHWGSYRSLAKHSFYLFIFVKTVYYFMNMFTLMCSAVWSQVCLTSLKILSFSCKDFRAGWSSSWNETKHVWRKVVDPLIWPAGSEMCLSDKQWRLVIFFGGGAQLGGGGDWSLHRTFFFTLNIYVLAMLDAVVLSYYFFNA